MKITIKATGQEKENIVFSEEPITFLEVMKQAGTIVYRPCGGIGKCGACRIQFLQNAPATNSYDERALTDAEITEGWRLGCKCVINTDCCILVPASLTSDIFSETLGINDTEINELAEYSLAVDIGTTTIAMAVVDARDGGIIKTVSAANSQIHFGSDVISRIQASIDGKKDELSALLIEDIRGLLDRLSVDTAMVKKCVISANTTMNHLLKGYEVTGLAASPFRPETLGWDSAKAFGDELEARMLPGISSFVGGDIVAGLYYLRDKMKNETALFLDLGTNAEIVLYINGIYYCTSASAGPALEGGNLSCGVPSIEGAIKHVIIRDNKIYTETINDASPIGICGSGVIDAIYELYRNKIIDEGGLLSDEYEEEGICIAGSVMLTGEDIQQVLLAKSAICSGIEILLSEAGVVESDIDHLYVAGGFGAAINPEAAAGIGIFPASLKDRYEAVGNTSLLGSARYAALSEDSVIEEIIASANVIELANHKDFESKFLSSLMLPALD